MSNYTYFIAFEDDVTPEGFTAHKIIYNLSVCDLAEAFDEFDINWYDKCGIITDVEAYAKVLLEPYLSEATHEYIDDDGDSDGKTTLQVLYDFLMKWQSYKVMIFSEPHYYNS